MPTSISFAAAPEPPHHLCQLGIGCVGAFLELLAQSRFFPIPRSRASALVDMIAIVSFGFALVFLRFRFVL